MVSVTYAASGLGSGREACWPATRWGARRMGRGPHAPPGPGPRLRVGARRWAPAPAERPAPLARVRRRALRLRAQTVPRSSLPSANRHPGTPKPTPLLHQRSRGLALRRRDQVDRAGLVVLAPLSPVGKLRHPTVDVFLRQIARIPFGCGGSPLGLLRRLPCQRSSADRRSQPVSACHCGLAH